MTFKDALQKGLAAHKRAAEARAEMNEVLASASAEVAEITGAPITLQFEQLHRPLQPLQKFTALTASSTGVSPAALAEVTFGELGYPLTLRWEDQLEFAQERVSFEEALKRLLGHAATGQKIATLIRQK